MHKSGFVNIVGSPNVGKSTLMNQLVGEKMSIISPKAQTTRHRVIALVNDEEHQIVFSDTPGVVNSAYKLHDNMMTYVNTAIRDADIMIFMTDIYENEMNHTETLERIKKLEIPVLVLVNKIDQADQERAEERLEYWASKIPNGQVLPISALHGFNTDTVLNRVKELLPEGEAYYDKEELTDRPLKFFVAEIIREKIFYQYKKEVPYSCEVVIEEYKEGKDLDKIRAIIYVERDSQKSIIIGHQGIKIKHVGIDARKDIEKFIDKKIFLDLYVKVDKNWRDEETKLKRFGY